MIFQRDVRVKDMVRCASLHEAGGLGKGFDAVKTGVGQLLPVYAHLPLIFRKYDVPIGA